MVRSGFRVFVLALLAFACGGRADSLNGVDDSAGGAGSSPGGATTGAHATSGGVTSSGGTPTSGGVTSSGGTPASGGAIVSNTGGASSDGAGSSPGSGGIDAAVPRCVPGASAACACTSGQLGAQLCGADGFYAPCRCELATLDWFRAQLVGKWTGTRQSPWDGAPNVTLELLSDGSWMGTCDGLNPIFYWGDTPSSGRYAVVSVNTDPEAFGELSVFFGPNDEQQGALRHIRFNEDQSRLWFEFWRTWGGEYGPLEFDLRRQ